MWVQGHFYAHDYASAGITSVCAFLLQVGVISKRMNESSWFLARELLSTYPALC